MVSGEPSISSSLLWFGAPPIEKPDGPELSKGRENFGVGVRRDTESQLRQHQRRAAIDRHVLDLPRVDHLAGGGLAVSSIEPSADTVTDWSIVPTSSVDIELLAFVGGDADLRVDVAFEPRRLRR